MSRTLNRPAFRYLPLVLWLVHACLAIVFAKDRIMNTDCSLQFFSSVNDRSFFFQESRYGMLPTQVPLVLGILLQLPIKWLVVIYSLSFPLIYGLIIWINQHVFGSLEAALAAAATLLIGWGSTFFHCTTETHLLLAASALLYGSYQALGAHGETLPWRLLPFAIALWCLSIHPNALFTIGFVTGLAWLNGSIKLGTGLIPLGLAAVYTLAAMLMAKEGSYDANQYDTLLGGLDRIAHIQDLAAVWFLLEWIGGQYLGAVIMAALVILLGRNWKLTAFMVVCVTGFTLITILTFPDGDSLAMMEKSYLPALFMIILTFCTVLARFRFPAPAAALLFGGAVFSIFTIHEASRPYSQRLAMIGTLLDGPGRQYPKMAVRKAPFEGTVMLENNWALSLDALIMSGYKGHPAQTLFMDDNADQVIAETPKGVRFLYTNWAPYGMTLKNRAYFDLPDGPYALVELPRQHNPD